MPTFHFTNPNGFVVYVYPVDARGYLGMGYVCDTARGGQNTLVQNWPEGTELRFGARETSGPTIFDSYKTTNEDIQTHTIRNVSITVSIHNNSKSDVFLFTVDLSGTEHSRGSLTPDTWFTQNDPRGALKPSTTWRIKDAAGTVLNSYVTNADHYQKILAIPESILPEVTPVIIPEISDPITIYSGPIDNPPIIIPPVRNNPQTLASVNDSIFNFNSWNFNWDVFDLEWSIRGRLPSSTDKHQIRAAVYAALMAIARIAKKDRTPKEQAVMDWLALQVKQTRVETARLALAEYDRWNNDPWGYHPPAGYGFPAYIIPTRNSPTWLFTTPNPPVLENQSLASFFAGIISNNGWSPINNPVILKGKKAKGITTLEGVVGFPVFGAARVFEKLYNTDAGVTVFANTLQQSIDGNINLLPTTAAVEAWRWINNVRLLNLQNLAPFSYRDLTEIPQVIASRAGGAGFAPTSKLVEKLTVPQLRTVMREIVSGEFLSRSVCTFVLTVALQAIISETVSLITRLNLRPELKSYLDEKKADPLPDLDNLLYYDIRNTVALFDPNYKPEDPQELERLMGPREAYRAFLLATVK